MTIRGLFVLATLTGCAHGTPLLLAPYRDNCPPPPVAVPSVPGNLPRILTRTGGWSPDYGHVTWIIDGHPAIVNNSRHGDRYTRRLGPDVDAEDIASIEIVKAPEAARRFGACPGVLVIVITTKRHDWRPYAR